MTRKLLAAVLTTTMLAGPMTALPTQAEPRITYRFVGEWWDVRVKNHTSHDLRVHCRWKAQSALVWWHPHKNVKVPANRQKQFTSWSDFQPPEDLRCRVIEVLR